MDDEGDAQKRNRTSVVLKQRVGELTDEDDRSASSANHVKKFLYGSRGGRFHKAGTNKLRFCERL